MAEPTTGVHTRIAEALAGWHAKRLTVCEHTQIIEYGAATEAVIAAVADEVDAYGEKLMDDAIQQVMDDQPGGYNATMRAATVQHVAKLLRDTAKGGGQHG